MILGCPICAGETSLAHHSAHGRIFRCRGCGTRVLAARSETTYDQGYYRSWFDTPPQDIEKIKRLNFQRLLEREVGCLKGKKLLDVGCATGFLLAEAQALGAEIFGVDVNTWAVAQARERLPEAGLYAGFLHEAIRQGVFTPASFEIIVGTDVIEHVAEVKDLFRDMIHLLKPGGVGIFTLPDVESLSCRLLGKYWFQYKPEHLTFPTRRALARLAAELGFVVEMVTPYKKQLSLGFITNVLTYHNRGLLHQVGYWGGRLAEGLGVSRIIFPVATGEMCLRIRKT